MSDEKKIPRRRSLRDMQEEEQWHWEQEEAARKAQEDEDAEEIEAREGAIEEMIGWFDENFEDPANDTPWDGEDKVYVFAWGGPFDASDMVGGHFSEEYPQEWIDEAVETIERDGIVEWSPKGSGDFFEHPEDERVIEARDDPAGFREQVLERLDKLELELSQLPTSPSSVGHNLPPEEIGLPPYTSETHAELQESIGRVRGELGTGSPDEAVLMQSEDTFRRVALSILGWIGRKAEMAVDETIKASIKAGVWGSVIASLIGIADDILALLQIL